jgi:(p)ppGpp synthase/HD superfamily hydrolase
MILDLDLKVSGTEGIFKTGRIHDAYEFAKKAHFGQKRESGEDYITHPLWVAGVTSQLGIGEEAVIAALLHDVVEDSDYTLEDIAITFGDEVALLVEGMTEVKRKTSGIEVHQTNIDIFRRFYFHRSMM